MESPKTLRQFEEIARQAHIARVRHVCEACANDVPERDKRLAQCQTLYAEDLRRAQLNFQAQQRAARGMRR